MLQGVLRGEFWGECPLCSPGSSLRVLPAHVPLPRPSGQQFLRASQALVLGHRAGFPRVQVQDGSPGGMQWGRQVGGTVSQDSHPRHPAKLEGKPNWAPKDIFRNDPLRNSEKPD